MKVKGNSYIWNGTADLIEWSPNLKKRAKNIGNLDGVKIKELPTPRFINKYKTKLWKLNKNLESLIT